MRAIQCIGTSECDYFWLSFRGTLQTRPPSVSVDLFISNSQTQKSLNKKVSTAVTPLALAPCPQQTRCVQTLLMICMPVASGEWASLLSIYLLLLSNHHILRASKKAQTWHFYAWINQIWGYPKEIARQNWTWIRFYTKQVSLNKNDTLGYFILFPFHAQNHASPNTESNNVIVRNMYAQISITHPLIRDLCHWVHHLCAEFPFTVK